jgi:hypothetical protein
MPDGAPIEPQKSGPSRRDMLRRSALVGGAVLWTTPVVQSLASPAFAGSSPVPGDNPCEHRFFIKYEPLEKKFATSDGNCSDSVAECESSGTIVITDSGNGAASIAIKNGPVIGSVVATSVSEACVELDFSFTNGCNVDESSTYVLYKTGNRFGGCVADQEGQLTDTVLDNPATDKYRICTTGGTGLSHVNLCVCLQCPVAPAP